MDSMIYDEDNIELTEPASIKSYNLQTLIWLMEKLYVVKNVCLKINQNIVMSQESHPIQNWPPGIHQSALEFLTKKPTENKKEKTKEIINKFYQDLKAKLLETIEQSLKQSLRDLDNCQFEKNDLLNFYNQKFKTKDLRTVFSNINEFDNEKYSQLLNEINQNKEIDLKELYQRIEKQKNSENQIRFAQPHQIKIIVSKLIQNINFFCPPPLCETNPSDGQKTNTSIGQKSNESEQSDTNDKNSIESDGYQSPSTNSNFNSLQSSIISNQNNQSNKYIPSNKMMSQSYNGIQNNQFNPKIQEYIFPSNKILPLKRNNFKSNTTFTNLSDSIFNNCSSVDITVSNVADLITQNLNKFSNLKVTILRNINALQTSLATHSNSIDKYISEANSKNQGLDESQEEQIHIAIKQIEKNIESLSCLISEEGLFCNVKQDCIRKIMQEFKSLDEQQIKFLTNYTNQKEYSHLSNNYLQDLMTLLHSTKVKFSNISFQKSNRHSSQQFDLGRNLNGNWQFSNNYIEGEGQIYTEQNLSKDTTYVFRFKLNNPFYKMNELAIGLIKEQNLVESIYYNQLCISNKNEEFTQSIKGQTFQDSEGKENTYEIEMRVNLDKGIIQFSDYPSYQNIQQNTKDIDLDSKYRVAICISGQNNKVITLTHYEESKDWIPFN